MNTLLVLSLIPFAAFMFMLLVRRASLVASSAAACAAMAVVLVWQWQMAPEAMGASAVKGAFVALDIFLIILGAVFFLDVLEKHRVVENISYTLESFSRDYRVRTILLAWFLENFIEGTAGFGTPTAIVAPLLVGMGFSPMRAVVLSLLGNSASVVFGAAGAPIRVGFADLAGPMVPWYAALVNIAGFVVPVFMLWFATDGQRDRMKQFFEAVPFAVVSGLAFVLSSLPFVFLGQEFPSILGSIAGLGIMMLCIRGGLFVPKTVRTLRDARVPEVRVSLLSMLFPYALLIMFLVAGKFLLGSVMLLLPFGVAHGFNLFNPGFAFLVAGGLTLWMWRKRMAVSGVRSFADALRRTLEPFVVIALMSTVTQLMVMSGSNASGTPSMLALIARALQNRLLPFWTPFLGMFGSFITGSATIADIMFGNALALAGSGMGMRVDAILALLVVGGAAGNMVALADMLTAETVVHMHHEESAVLKSVIIPCAVYVSIVGIVGLIFVS